MKLSKFALVTGVSATMAVAALPSHAMVYGVAGEAMLAPLVMNDTLTTGTGATNTYVVLKLPSVLGSDFVLNNYSAPNIRKGVPAGTAKTIVPNPDYGWTVHWTWFDPKSKNPKNDTCEGSANDVIVWTTDQDLLDLQDDIDDGTTAVPDGVPMTFCGSSTLPAAGYVVFQTASGSDSLTADFAMEATGYITDADLAENPVALLSLPMIPMADGEDAAPSSASSSPQLGVNEVIQPVTSAGGNKGDFVLISPVVASPLATGIRMNDGNPGTQLAVTFAGGVQGSLGPDAYSLHVLWFDRNDENRQTNSVGALWDEHEYSQSFTVPIDYELNMILWNADADCLKDCITAPVWPTLGGLTSPAEGTYVNLTGAIMNPSAAVQGTTFGMPRLWDQTVMGYFEYQLAEEGDELGGPNGTPGTNAAAVAFEAQEDMLNGDAWSQHLMTLRGFR